jgi:hypothetical protein
MRRFKEYERAWKITEMMPVFASTITTARNHFSMAFEPETLSKRIRILRNPDKTDDELKRQFNLEDVSYWKISDARKELAEIDDVDSFVRPYCYRPFDDRYVYYHPAVCERLRTEVMTHVQPGNISLLTHRPQSPSGEFNYIFSTMMLGDQCVAANKTTGGGNSFQFPLYLYPNGNLPEEDLFAHDNGRRPNLSAEFIKDFCATLQVKFVPDGLGRPSRREFGPEFIFQYAYAVFHSPTYRERYAEFLRADFPRLPLTSDFELFRTLGGLGAELVGLHARGKGEPKGISFPVKDGNVIEEVRYQPAETPHPGPPHEPERLLSPSLSSIRNGGEGGRRPGEEALCGSGVQSANLGSGNSLPVGRGEGVRRTGEGHSGRVWINKLQYVEGVPESAWTFPIGGYLPAQRWLKDRIGRTFGFTEQEEYIRIVWALIETKRLMGEIDSSINKHGGWPLK